MATDISVLVVDDSEPVRDSIRTIVEMLPGCRVAGEAADGPAAVEQARRLQPDVVLMDINLPGCDGLAAAEQILAGGTATRVIVISVENGREYFRRALQVGACNFLVKPFTPDGLEEAIRRAVGGAAPEGSRALVVVGAQGGVGTSCLAAHLAGRLSGSVGALGTRLDDLGLLVGERVPLAARREEAAVLDGGRTPPAQIPPEMALLVVLEPSVPSLHGAAAYAKLSPRFVVNKMGCAGGLSVDEVARGLGVAPAAILPEDAAVRQAANLGRVGDLDRGPWHAAVGELLVELGLVGRQAPKRTRLLRSLIPGGERS
ncbi:MAG TPA: response regulator [Bacillota bacterium]|nr:response regulator [Bacillota bacterium]